MSKGGEAVVLEIVSAKSEEEVGDIFMPSMLEICQDMSSLSMIKVKRRWEICLSNTYCTEYK